MCSLKTLFLFAFDFFTVCFKNGGKSRTSAKTDDEELEISSPSILRRIFGTKKRFYERRKQTIRLLGHQATVATNGGSSYMFLIRPLISFPCYSLKSI